MVIRELERVKQKIVIFVDPSLSIDIAYTKELFRKMSNLNKRFACFVNINVANDEEFLKLASEAGCIAFSIGFETLPDSAMRRLSKLPKEVEVYRKVVERIHDHGITVLASFAFGFDDDKKDVFENSVV